MKEIKGTPKQVAWAEQIRQALIENKDKARVYIHRGALHKSPADHKQASAWAETIMERLNTYIKYEESAAKWINDFKLLTSKYAKHSPEANIVGILYQSATMDDELFDVLLYATNFLPGGECHKILDKIPCEKCGFLTCKCE